MSPMPFACSFNMYFMYVDGGTEKENNTRPSLVLYHGLENHSSLHKIHIYLKCTPIPLWSLLSIAICFFPWIIILQILSLSLCYYSLLPILIFMLIFFTFSFRPATNKKLIYLLLPLSIGISIIICLFYAVSLYFSKYWR